MICDNPIISIITFFYDTCMESVYSARLKENMYNVYVKEVEFHKDLEYNL